MILINGSPSPTGAGQTVAALVAALGLDAGARGVAVAVDGVVVPRAAWSERVLEDEARVEVLSAMQGG